MGGLIILLEFFRVFYYGVIFQIHIIGLIYIAGSFGLLGAYDDYKKIKLK